MRYIDGFVSYYDNYDPNLMSYIELENLIKDLGYQRIEQLYYTILGLSLEEGLKSL